MRTRSKLALGLIAGLSLVTVGALLGASGRSHRLTVRHEIATQLAPNALWGHLEAAFRDSSASPLWPNELETLRSEGLAPAAQVTATYRTPFGDSSHTYTIGEYTAGQGFTYATGPAHPLRGGGRVLLTPTADGATLVWTIDYAYRGFSASALFVRFYFVPRFFARLEANLQAIE